MKLTQEQIKSIDAYLKNSDIQFIDVRMELVDHIASALEEKISREKLSFYDAFKLYMVKNKRDLVKNYEKQKKKNQLKGFGMVWKNLKKPWSIALFVLSAILLLNFRNLFGIEFPYLGFMWSLLIGIILTYIIFSYPLKKNRFSGLEALSWAMFLISYLFQLLFNFGKSKPLLYEQIPIAIDLFVTGLFCFCLAWIVTFFEQRKAYKIKFKKA